ncbi:unnamed protein product [Medioppia subpectinata]|uniref:Gustatory receptor n=1 Tax=Medioppia subpectinata TaxID=1979941 RepID=A0A7R9KUQ2_9ACAR|nr:unnamed protein product [Medioppia subpectinata]CAG2110199.1 unnamed protein product [Medioppia subpectinata]
MTYLQSPLIAILSHSFEEYVINKHINKRRQIFGVCVCIYGWLTVIKFFTAAFIKDPTLWPLIGDPFYLTGDRILFNLVIGSIALNASAMRTIFLIGESNRKFSFIHELYCLQTGRQHYLLKDNLRKFNIRCVLSLQLMLKQIPFNALVLFSLIYGYYTVCAILRQDYGYSITVSVVWFVLTSYAAWVAASMQGVSYSLLYLTQYYLNLRFRQVANKIVYSLHKNKTILLNLLEEHHRIVELTVHYNAFFNRIIAVNYFAATIAINLLLYIAFFGDGNVFFRIGNGLIAVNKIIVICLATYSAAQFSDELVQVIERLSGPTIEPPMRIRKTPPTFFIPISRRAGVPLLRQAPPPAFCVHHVFFSSRKTPVSCNFTIASERGVRYLESILS